MRRVSGVGGVVIGVKLQRYAQGSSEVRQESSFAFTVDGSGTSSMNELEQAGGGASKRVCARGPQQHGSACNEQSAC
jgi:hypothetical protein